MRSPATILVFAALLVCVSCTSKVKDAQNLKKRVDTMNDCFPNLYEKAQTLLDIAESWRLNSGQMIPDPPGLTWAEQTDGSLTVQYTVAACTIAMTIRFYSPVGVEQDLDLGTPTTLGEAIDAAASALRDLFGDTDKFMVGVWTLTGPNAVGSGAITGIIGGTTNQNELEELRTTTGQPAGGPPPLADGMVTVTGATTCDLTFRTAALQTDTVVNQAYPIGTLSFTITGPEATVTATITFNNTVIATVVVDEVPGSFAYNLDTGELDYNP